MNPRPHRAPTIGRLQLKNESYSAKLYYIDSSVLYHSVVAQVLVSMIQKESPLSFYKSHMAHINYITPINMYWANTIGHFDQLCFANGSKILVFNFFLAAFTSLPFSKKVYNRNIDILVIFVICKPVLCSSAELTKLLFFQQTNVSFKRNF